MIPIGYMYKRVAVRPDWLKAPEVEDIHSVSGCISKNFVDDFDYRYCNGYGLFDRPENMERLAAERGIDLEGMTLFYYEADENEFDAESKRWELSAPSEIAPVNVVRTNRSRVEGYDVANFLVGPIPDCSPLSCNYLARELQVNRHCLFDTFDAAREALENGQFDNSEPGPFRIIAVHILDPEPVAG